MTKDDILSFWKDLGRRPMSKVPSRLYWSKFHMTSKAGPNGQALWFSLVDLFNIKDLPLLLDIYTLGGERLTNIMKSTIAYYEQLSLVLNFIPFGLGKGRIRKITAIPDKEGKTRVVAIVDYWSQTALRPLHTFLLQILKAIPQDRTFSQGKFFDTLPSDSKVFYSVDLTAYTDRFPIELVAKVLKGILPDSYVDSWLRVMVGTPFEFQNHKLLYGTGTPMGAYSSWASTTLAHHFVVWKACQLAKVSWRELHYALLGDDIVIANKEVAERYIGLIKGLGVEVSDSKTHVSEYLYEFAKRWVYKGDEISPFPLSALSEAATRYYNLVSVLIESEPKGWVSTAGVPQAVADYYGTVRTMPSKFRKRILDRATLSDLIIRIMRGLSPASVLNDYARMAQIRIPLMRERVCQSILSNVAVEMFAESNPTGKSNDRVSGLGLGDLATNIVIGLTGITVTNNNPSVNPPEPSHFPLSAVYGQIEESYLGMVALARRVDTVESGNWPAMLRSMLLPISDRVFFARGSEMVPMASATVGRRVKERLQLISSSDYFIRDLQSQLREDYNL
jgi:hypothetical protein